MKSRKRRHAPPGWEEERKERLRQQRRQKALRESSKHKPFPVTTKTVKGDVVKLTRAQKHKARYDRYIKSEQWAKRKVEYYFKHPKICWRCQSIDNLHLHHHTYLRLGDELDEDLVPLCQSCHRRVHDLEKSEPGYDITDATIEAIGEHPNHLPGFKVVLVEPNDIGRPTRRRYRRPTGMVKR